MRECLPGGLMAWVLVIMHMAMANDAAPWLVQMVMVGMSTCFIPCSACSESTGVA